jgi:hypothetical protein
MVITYTALAKCIYFVSGDFMSFPGIPIPEFAEKNRQVTSPSRTYFTAPLKSIPKVEPDKNVIEVPRVIQSDNGTDVKEPNGDTDQEQLLKPASVGETANNIKNGNADGDAVKKSDDKIESKEKVKDEKNIGGLNIGEIGNLIKEKGYEMGVKLKNKTMEVGEKMKNKTLEHLAVISGGEQKNIPQLVFVPTQWNLSVSFEDIGDLLKETQFLNKVGFHCLVILWNGERGYLYQQAHSLVTNKYM